MKTNKFMRIASVLLVAVVLTTCAISGTFAKYTSTVNGSDTARVAKWAFSFGADDTQIGNTMTFNLFDHTDANVDYDGTGAEKVIAPGTSGSFQLAVENKSEVNAEYSIVLAETVNTADIPVLYSLTGEDGTWFDITGLNMTSVTDNAIDMGVEETFTLYWKWDFEQTDVAVGDAADTADGIAAVSAVQNITVTADITVTQVD